jgi:serine/threonine-protein kinase RsbW
MLWPVSNNGDRMSDAPHLFSRPLAHPGHPEGFSTGGAGDRGGAGDGSDADSLWIINNREKIDSIQDRVVNAAEVLGYSSSAQFALRLAIEEAIINAFKHGHAGLDPKTPIHVHFEVTSSRIFIAVEDQGSGFTPEDVPDPTLDENLERPSGRGLILMRAYMTRVDYNDRGNRVEMELIKPESDAAG